LFQTQKITNKKKYFFFFFINNILSEWQKETESNKLNKKPSLLRAIFRIWRLKLILNSILILLKVKEIIK
jgi:hypothetical protein